ncbi:hypothetical protein J6524_35640 [Bradyrhizobium sp. WSM 1738]|uniref:hypothetical protein n=1 Tax=Bradyrhizobium hereditatis TaxID=2821405 RepID=UPI001CE38EE8|nr:hypothetical protein [Bradyrhizobium hereditatis]MCA6120131.1 hypothetical protein [Bradyrhizobium hereditatis]
MNSLIDHWSGKLNFILMGDRNNRLLELGLRPLCCTFSGSRSPSVAAPKYSASTFFKTDREADLRSACPRSMRATRPSLEPGSNRGKQAIHTSSPGS